MGIFYTTTHAIISLILVLGGVFFGYKAWKAETETEANRHQISFVLFYAVAVMLTHKFFIADIRQKQEEFMDWSRVIEEVVSENIRAIEEMRGENMEEAHKVPAQRKTVSLDWKCSVCECDVSDDDNYCANCGAKFQPYF